jgi:rare lipoprotein A
VRSGALLFIAFLSGCGALRAPPPETPPAAPPAKGGYYKDDGPGANPPADLASIPDAVPRAEPPHRFANRPYQALGKQYLPLASAEGFRQRGVASWYGRRYHGQNTSSGERYDMYAMTAAHPTLPIPSYARVTRADNGRSVVVRINDRGPFHAERVIDLSYTAAWKLGMVEAGSALVDVEAVVPGETTAAEAPKNVYLQLGAFSARASAENFRARLARELAWLSETIQVVAADALYRLQLGPYRNHDEARPVAERIRRELDLAPLLVVR